MSTVPPKTSKDAAFRKQKKDSSLFKALLGFRVSLREGIGSYATWAHGGCHCSGRHVNLDVPVVLSCDTTGFGGSKALYTKQERIMVQLA